MERGYGVLLAHPERCPAFIDRPRRLRELVDRGVLCSITAGALAGRFGAASRWFALELLRDGLAHSVDSDAHDADGRPPGPARGPARGGDRSCPRWRGSTAWLAEDDAGGDPVRRPAAAPARLARDETPADDRLRGGHRPARGGAVLGEHAVGAGRTRRSVRTKRAVAGPSWRTRFAAPPARGAADVHAAATWRRAPAGHPRRGPRAPRAGRARPSAWTVRRS